MKFVPIIIMFAIAGCFQDIYSSEISHKNSVKNKTKFIIPVRQYYLLLKMPSKRRRYSNEAHFFVGKPQENLDMEDVMSIYSLLNKTESPKLQSIDNRYVLDKKTGDIASLPLMYRFKEPAIPNKNEWYMFGTPKINWITNSEVLSREETAINGLTSTSKLSINIQKKSRGCDLDLVIERPFVNWITNNLPIECRKPTTAKTKWNYLVI